MFKKKISTDDLASQVASLIVNSEDQVVDGIQKNIKQNHRSHKINKKEKSIIEVWLLCQTLIPAHNLFKDEIAQNIVLDTIGKYTRLKCKTVEEVNALTPKIGNTLRELMDLFNDDNYNPGADSGLTNWLFKKLGWKNLKKDKALIISLDLMVVSLPHATLMKEYSDKYKVFN